MRRIKLFPLFLGIIVILASMSPVVIAVEDQNVESPQVTSSSDDNCSYDCVLVTLNPSAVVARSAITPESLGLSSGYAIEQIYEPGVSADEGSSGKNIYSVELPEATKEKAEETLAILENSSLVENCSLNYYVYVDTVTPNDASYATQYAHSLCSTADAWDYSTGSTSVAVAVIDTGIELSHPDLAPNIWTKPGEVPNDGIDNDGNGFVDDYHGWDFVNNDNDSTDDHGHGTHVAGIIGAVGNNSIGVAGVCWNVKIVPIKVLGSDGSGDTANIIKAINYASGLNIPIVNLSLGGGNYNSVLKDAIDGYFGLVVTSAGNKNTNTDTFSHYPSSYPCNNIISVANSTSSDDLNYWSNYGATTVDLAAPGTSIYSTTFDGGYGNKSGTSMAAPYVAGAAALIKSLNPHASTSDLKNALLQNVDLLPQLAGKVLTGGRINVKKALTYFIILGDADLNGVVNEEDINCIKNHILNPTLSGNSLLAADANQDGVVSVVDLSVVKSIILQS